MRSKCPLNEDLVRVSSGLLLLGLCAFPHLYQELGPDVVAQRRVDGIRQQTVDALSRGAQLVSRRQEDAVGRHHVGLLRELYALEAERRLRFRIRKRRHASQSIRDGGTSRTRVMVLTALPAQAHPPGRIEIPHKGDMLQPTNPLPGAAPAARPPDALGARSIVPIA